MTSFKRMAVGLIQALCCLLPAVGIGADADTITVFTSIVPQEYFVERIGGERVDVQALVKPGSSPATYEPTPRQMAALAEAAIFFRIGVPFENAVLPKIEAVATRLRVVDTRQGIPLRKMQAHDPHAHDPHAGTRHSHAEHAEHAEGARPDPHIWLNPRFVKVQARTIADALRQVDPAGAPTYRENLAAFLEDLDALDATLAEVLKSVEGRTFMVFHPAWGYFADAYGLNQTAIESEGKNPSVKQLARIIEQAQAEQVRIIFVQPQFSRRLAERVAEAIDGVALPIDPLARDYISNLERVAHTVREALDRQK